MVQVGVQGEGTEDTVRTPAHAALEIQSAARGHIVRTRRSAAMLAALRIQTHTRGHSARAQRLAILKAVRAIQAKERGKQTRTYLAKVRNGLTEPLANEEEGEGE